MDWDLKMPPWDLAELEQNAAPNLGSLVASSVGLGRQTSRIDCSVDLKLGGLGDFGSSENWKEQPRASTLGASSSSSKRSRALGNGGLNASCLVDGCKADLSNCREYHRRHKVCEVHSKTPIVLVGGQEQRFCQQCSRFHLLVEFDEVKRSCRKRLDGHNRRRRKPQPESNNSGSFFPSHQGSRFSSYPPIFPSPTAESNWAGVVKTEEDVLYTHTHHPHMHFIDRQQHFPSSFNSYREGKQFPFLQDSTTTLGSRMTLEPAACQPLPKTISSVESSSNRVFPDGLTHVLDSDCALSLLSSPAQTSGINLGQMVSADRIPMGQPLVSSLHYGGLSRYSHSQASNNVSTTGFSCPGVEDDRGGTVLVSDASGALFHVASGGSSNVHSQALPFSWQQ